jgi:putative transposase
MRAVLLPLDPTPAQEKLMRSYCGASRFAYNWTVAIVKENLDTREAERRAGIKECYLTKSLSWSAWSMTPLWNSVKNDVAPWHRDVTKHAFISGVTNAATALKNFDESRKGVRKGKPVEFPVFKDRHSKLSFTMTEFKPGYWFSEDSRHLRLIQPQASSDPRISRRRKQLQWIHTTESFRRLKGKVTSGEWTIQAVTISFVGDRWRASILLRQYAVPAPSTGRQIGQSVGVDLGVRYLATLTKSVNGLSDENGHVENQRHLDAYLERLAKLDRQLSRCVKGSRNQAKLRRRRQRLSGRCTRTRNLYLNRLTTSLAGRFETVVIENLDIAGMMKKGKQNTAKSLRRSIFDAGWGELRRQLTYKTEERGHCVVVVNRYYPSSKMCSHCGETRAKLALSDRVFECSNCGIYLDRDVNAARNIRDEGIRLLTYDALIVAGHQPETLNADSRDLETDPCRRGRRDRNQSRTTQPAGDLPLLA